jgi:hypothetical protein
MYFINKKAGKKLLFEHASGVFVLLISGLMVLGCVDLLRSAEDKGSLDLPDIFIWGEDRSELPGIGEEDVFLLPYIKKTDYLEPLRLRDPLKLHPSDEYLLKSYGYGVQGGVGIKGEYLYRAVGEYFEREKMFGDIDVMGSGLALMAE